MKEKKKRSVSFSTKELAVIVDASPDEIGEAARKNLFGANAFKHGRRWRFRTAAIKQFNDWRDSKDV